MIVQPFILLYTPHAKKSIENSIKRKQNLTKQKPPSEHLLQQELRWVVFRLLRFVNVFAMGAYSDLGIRLF